MRMTKRYCIRNDGSIYDTQKRETISIYEVIKRLNRFNESEDERWFNNRF